MKAGKSRPQLRRALLRMIALGATTASAVGFSPATAAQLGIKCSWSIAKDSWNAGVWDNFWIDTTAGSVYSNRMQSSVAVEKFLPGLVQVKVAYDGLVATRYYAGSNYQETVGRVEFTLVIDRITGATRPVITSGAKDYKPEHGSCTVQQLF